MQAKINLTKNKLPFVLHKNFIMKTVLLKPAMPHTTRVEEESWLGIHFLHSRLFIASYFLKRGRRKKEHGRGRRGISYMPGRKKVSA